nr:hypothetical protein [Acidocella sp. MX-AZ02]
MRRVIIPELATYLTPIFNFRKPAAPWGDDAGAAQRRNLRDKTGIARGEILRAEIKREPLPAAMRQPPARPTRFFKNAHRKMARESARRRKPCRARTDHGDG